MDKNRERDRRVAMDVDSAIDELQLWHDQAEAEFNYLCPGCSTCAVIIPRLKRVVDMLTIDKGGE